MRLQILDCEPRLMAKIPYLRMRLSSGEFYNLAFGPLGVRKFREATGLDISKLKLIQVSSLIASKRPWAEFIRSGQSLKLKGPPDD